MQKTYSINENKVFKRLYYRGKKDVSHTLVLYHMPGRKGENRLGITVSAKIGRAVVRNRIKRLIKESYRLLEPDIKAGYDIVIVARQSVLGSDFHRIQAALSKQLGRAGLIETNKFKSV